MKDFHRLIINLNRRKHLEYSEVIELFKLMIQQYDRNPWAYKFFQREDVEELIFSGIE